jgi:hypothetical protein
MSLRLDPTVKYVHSSDHPPDGPYYPDPEEGIHSP